MGDGTLSGKSLVNSTEQIRKGVCWFEAGLGFSRRDRTADVDRENALFTQYLLRQTFFHKRITLVCSLITFGTDTYS